jgi:hypothetical protein
MGRSKTHNGKCNGCSKILIAGENWSPSNVKNKNYKCKPCISLDKSKKYKEDSSYYKKYAKDNSKKITAYVKQWQLDRKDEMVEYNKQRYQSKQTKILNYNNELNKSEGLGIYNVMLGDTCLYVGEGQLKQRKKKHLRGNCFSSSAVAEYCHIHDINRKLLSFNVLGYTYVYIYI